MDKHSFRHELQKLEDKAENNPVNLYKTAISIYIPANAPYELVIRQLTNEASRISQSTTELDQKKILLSLLLGIEKHLHEKGSQSPQKGIGIFCLPNTNQVPLEPAPEIADISDLVPITSMHPIEEFLYVCDWQFYLEHFRQ